MFINALLTSVVVGCALGADVIKAPRTNKIAGQYIVRLQDHESVDTLRSHVKSMKEKLGSHMEELAVYENLAAFKTVGYSVKLSSVGLDLLKKESSIKTIEEDMTKTIYTSPGCENCAQGQGCVCDTSMQNCHCRTNKATATCNHETNADWGLARTNDRNFTKAKTYNYDYSTGASGAGVDAYVIDTGIYCDNNDFKNKKTGSCTFGYSSVKKRGQVDVTDDNGHGTHVAGTIGGQEFGIAKEVDLIAVKVMSDSGSGSSTNILSGIDWVIGNAQKTKKPSVANLSIGGGYSQTENDAMASAVNSGITMVVAAGNEDEDACDGSPASEPLVVTVAASDVNNDRAYYSNWGKCVDVFGPGTDITSTWIGSADATNTISGTSMACPHVTGVAAKIRSADNSLSSTGVGDKIVADATMGQISDLKGSPNAMVYANCI